MARDSAGHNSVLIKRFSVIVIKKSSKRGCPKSFLWFISRKQIIDFIKKTHFICNWFELSIGFWIKRGVFVCKYLVFEFEFKKSIQNIDLKFGKITQNGKNDYQK